MQYDRQTEPKYSTAISVCLQGPDESLWAQCICVWGPRTKRITKLKSINFWGVCVCVLEEGKKWINQPSPATPGSGGAYKCYL